MQRKENEKNGRKENVKKGKREGKEEKTRPDTRQFSCGRLGGSSDAKTTRNSKMLRTDRPTDRHGKEQSRVSATKNERD